MTAHPAALRYGWLDATNTPVEAPGEILARFIGGPADGRTTAVIARGQKHPPIIVELAHEAKLGRPRTTDVYVLDATALVVTYRFKETT